MSEKPDGGPAFPCREATNAPNEGMTLRDYFAAHAIPLAAKWEEEAPTGHYGSKNMEPTYAGIATRAYFLADAMLKERDK